MKTNVVDMSGNTVEQAPKPSLFKRALMRVGDPSGSKLSAEDAYVYGKRRVKETAAGVGALALVATIGLGVKTILFDAEHSAANYQDKIKTCAEAVVGQELDLSGYPSVVPEAVFKEVRACEVARGDAEAANEALRYTEQ